MYKKLYSHIVLFQKKSGYLFSYFTFFLVLVIFSSCEAAFNAPVKEFFDEYTETASIVKHKISETSSHNGELYISSDKDVNVTFYMRNPQNFTMIKDFNMTLDFTAFDESGATASSGITALNELAKITLKQDTANKSVLSLYYPKSFLESAETGFDISPSINVKHPISQRDFGTYTGLKLKVNTPPPTVEYSVPAKSIGNPSYYVMCFKVPEMEKTISSGELLHKDILNVTVNGISYDLKINSTKNNFEKPNYPEFINVSETEKLPDSSSYTSLDVPTDNWILYYKTDVEAPNALGLGGGKKKDYTIIFTDKAGLHSKEYKANTHVVIPEQVKLYFPDTSSPIPLTTSVSSPRILSYNSETSLTLTAKTSTTTASIKGFLEKKTNLSWTKVLDIDSSNSNTITINIETQDDPLYRISLYAGGDGFSDTQTITWYVKPGKKDKTPILKITDGVSAEEKDYSSIDMIADVRSTLGTESNPFVIYTQNTQAKVTASVPDVQYKTVKYKLNDSVEQTANLNAEIALNIGKTKIEVCAADEYNFDGPRKTLYIQVKDALTTYTEFKNTTKNIVGGASSVIRLQNIICDLTSSEIEITKHLTIEGKDGVKTIDAAEKGRIFNVKSGANLTLKKLILKNGKIEASGGAIYSAPINTSSDIHITLDNVNIENCEALPSVHGSLISGGAIYAENTKVTIKSNSIIKNCTAEYAGAVNMNGGVLQISDSTIESCTGKWIRDGVPNYKVGGIGVLYSGTHTIKNSIIKNCTGSGIEIGYKVKLYLISTRIENNSIPAGTSSGIGAIVSPSNSIPELHIAGSTKFSDRNDVLVSGYNSTPVSGSIIVIDGNLTESIVATITPKEYVVGKQLIKLNTSAITLAQAAAKFKVTPQKVGNHSYIQWNINEHGKLEKAPINIDSTTVNAWQKLKEAVQIAQNGDIIVINGEIKATTAADNNGEIKITKNLTIKGKTGAASDILNADKNEGGKPDHRIFKVTGGSLTLNNLTLKNGDASQYSSNQLDSSGGGILLESGAALLTNVTISECKAVTTGGCIGNGGGIYVKAGTLTMNDTVISANEATKNGGGVYIEGGILTITNTTIGGTTAAEGNKASSGGGVFVTVGGKFIMDSGEISYNKTESSLTNAEYGGGVCVYGKISDPDNSASFVMKNGTISNNTATYGAGVGINNAGKFEMENGTISNNTAKNSGGGVYSGGKFIQKGGTIQNNTAKGEGTIGGGGGVFVWKSFSEQKAFQMSGGIIRGNIVEGLKKGAGIRVLGNSGFTMQGSAKIAVDNDVYLDDTRTINIEGVLNPEDGIAACITPAQYPSGSTPMQVLEGNITDGNPQNYTKFRVTQQDLGGGNSEQWGITDEGKLKKTSAVIKGSVPDAWKKLKEAVDAIGDGGTIIIEGLVQSTSAGGNNGEIIIDKDLTIQGKTGAASDILDANKGAFTDKEDKHRIFHVKDGKKLTLKKLTLKNGAVGNKAAAGGYGTRGGGILLKSGTVSLSDVTLSGCKAITDSGEGGLHGNGAGIYVVSGDIIMENTTLSENNADAYGGAVVLNGGTLAMKGSTVVTPSTGSYANKMGKNDVLLFNGAKIILDGALTGSVPVARITVWFNEYLPTRQVLDGTAVGSNNTKFTVTDQNLGTDNNYSHVRKWKIKSDGYLQSEEVTLDGSETRAWQALKDAVRTASDGDVIAINGTIQATNLGTGEYVDNGEIVIDKNLTIKKADTAATAVLDANKDAGGKPKHRIFKVESGNTLTLENLTLKGGIAEMSDMDGGGGVYVETSGKLIMTGSSITDCEAIGDTVDNIYGEGGGVNNKGTVEMTGGEIKNNKARNGGGVHNRGTLILTNATLTGNTATFIGGALCLSFGSSSEMTGGKIISNTCSGTSGGGVYIHAGTFKLNSSASIESNTASYGGGAYVNQNGTLIINGGSIKLNKAQSRGGGVYVSGNSTERGTLRMIQGDISDNGAGWNGTSYTGTGGGVYNEGGTVEISGGEIKSNTAKYGGGIYVKDAGATLTMSGGTVSANKAEKDSPADTDGGNGGGVYIDNAAFTLKAGTISNNTAARDAGGVRLFGGTFTMEGGVIEGNTVTGTSTASGTGRAGGVEIVAATMNMKGGEIKNNTAKNGGGGVWLGLSGAHNAELNMSGGTISGNMLTNSAGTGKGVEFFTGSTTHGSTTYYTIMKMSGSAKVDTNNDVYVNDSRMITVDGVLTPAGGIAARLTPKTYGTTRQVLEAGTGVNLANEAGKFTVTPNGSEHWIVGNSGTLLNFGAISLDEIKALESSMSPALITNRANLVNKLLFYKTSDGNYGVMVVTAVDNTTPGSVTFNYKTFNSNGTIKKSDNNHQEAGTNVFDLDSSSSESTAGDFWLQNSSTQNFQPKNGAKFYIVN